MSACQPLRRRHLEVDRSDLIWRLAANAFIGYLRFPGVGYVQRNRRLVLGDVHSFRRCKPGEQEGASEGSEGKAIFFMYFGADAEPAVGLRR
jgi:hypothetical protein